MRLLIFCLVHPWDEDINMSYATQPESHLVSLNDGPDPYICKGDDPRCRRNNERVGEGGVEGEGGGASGGCGGTEGEGHQRTDRESDVKHLGRL